MRSSIVIASVFGATGILAAPVYPDFSSIPAAQLPSEVIAEYFNLLASKVQDGRSGMLSGECDLSKAVLPSAASLPAPLGSLKHIVIGRGTQNYTCDTTNATAAPVQIGAVATLFNSTCVAAMYPDVAKMLPKLAMQFHLSADMSDVDQHLGPSNLVVTGHHYFTNPTTPFFNLDGPVLSLGHSGFSKNASAPAPADAPKGLNGELAVPWLKLNARSDATGGLLEVYRVETAGGSAPANCASQPASFEVQYATQYWFYEARA